MSLTKRKKDNAMSAMS
jgi:hypothetical protein